MSHLIRNINITLITFIVILTAVIICMGCGNSTQDRPTVADIQEPYETRAETIEEHPKPNITLDEDVHITTQIDMGKIVSHVYHQDTPDVDEVNKIIGQPETVVVGKTIKLETRVYNVEDELEIIIVALPHETVYLGMNFKHGFATSLQALEACGFKEEELTLVRHEPQQNINGAHTLAQDIYSAVTNHKVYEYISVTQNNKGIWFNVHIREKIAH